MAKQKGPELPLECLRDLAAWLEAAGTKGVVIGGIAASLLGRPRVTRDVDALVFVQEADWDEFLRTGVESGFDPRDPDPLAFAHESRVLLMRHRPTGIDVDVVFGALPFEREVIRRSREKVIGNIAIPLPHPADLVAMKAIAHRPRDLADIEGILESHPRLDLRRPRRLVKEFADALEAPEIVEDFERVVARRRKPKKR